MQIQCRYYWIVCVMRPTCGRYGNMVVNKGNYAECYVEKVRRAR